ncbi:MAG TPA: energy transducer TonB [Patescibacteria group bacterium]|nr:energy transducer TonB [Patescibacteria group bacterium]
MTGFGATLRQGAGRRLGGLTFVVLLHVAVVAALLNGASHRAAVVVPPQVIMASILSEPKPTPPTPRPVPVEPPRVVARPVPVKRPPPPLPILRSVSPTPAAVVAPASPVIVPQQAEVVAVAAPVSRAEPVRSAAKVDASHSCRPPDYPAISRRMGESGAVVVKFLIDENGAVLDSVVETSSGHPRLDDAAREALALCRFTPGTVDGKPERAWARLQYVWKLD